MKHDIENATFEPEVITVEVTEDDFIREAEDEDAPRILGQLKYFFWHIKHEHWEGNRYSFMTTLFDDPDLRPLCVIYDSDKKLIQLSYSFSFDNPLMFFFFRDDDLPEEMTAEEIEDTRTVTRMLPALINENTDTAWICYDKENDAMWCKVGVYVTGTQLNKRYLTRVLEEIVRCRNLCLHILENVVYGNDASETECDIKSLIQSYLGLQENAAPDAQD